MPVRLPDYAREARVLRDHRRRVRLLLSRVHCLECQATVRMRCPERERHSTVFCSVSCAVEWRQRVLRHGR